MPLSAQQRALYARHLLLPEIGEAGQELLLGSIAQVQEGAQEQAAEVAAEYLARAGLQVVAASAGEGQGVPVNLPTPSALQRLAGRPELQLAAAALAGAVSAVESIKQALQLGTSASPLHDISLSPEDV
jgi:hypothetical protein